MNIKKFKASSMKEALLLVKADLGPHAVILNSRKLGGSLFGHEKIEVTAALDENSYAKPEAAKPAEVSLSTYTPRSIKRSANSSRVSGNTAVLEKYRPEPFDHFSAPTVEPEEGFTALKSDLDRMRDAVYTLAEKSGSSEEESLPKGLKAVRESLEQNEVESAHIRTLIDRMKKEHTPAQQADDVWMKRSLFRMVEGEIKVSGHIRKGEGRARRIALVGPTGVGKTTTIAKLAAHFRLKEDLNIALIAADNYRMAAIEQIQQFADIASIPLEIVYTDEEMRAALNKFTAYDIVFIDTAGRSQRNLDQMNDLRRTLIALEPDEVHLTVSVTTKMKDLKTIERKYSEIGYHRLIFTKLDETVSYGTMYNLLKAADKPLSYVSTGQNIPDDISVADAPAVANLVVGGGAA